MTPPMLLRESSHAGATTTMLHACVHPGCGLLTFGRLCVRHDTPVTRTFVRGRPFLRTTTSGSLTPRVGDAA